MRLVESLPTKLLFLMVVLCLFSGCANQTSSPLTQDGRGDPNSWSIGIGMGQAMATTRAKNHSNVSLRVLCGMDRFEKLMLTARVEGLDPTAVSSINGMIIPMKLTFDDGSSFDVDSTVIADARGNVALGHQVVTLSQSMLRAIKRSRKLRIYNVTESYDFSLKGADSAIAALKCRP